MSAEHVTVLSLFPHLTFVIQVNIFSYSQKGFWSVEHEMLDQFYKNRRVYSKHWTFGCLQERKLAVTMFSCLPAVHTVYRPFFGGNTPIFCVVFYLVGPHNTAG